jgi:serine protease Do
LSSFFRSPNSPGGNEPFQNEQFRQQGLGSGVIVERRGNTIYVLTNNHVVEGADEIEVNLNDGRTFDAEMIGGDPLRDLALVAFDTREDVPVARLGDSDEVWVGDWVLAVGNPLGFESTVTAGIISAKGRRAQGQSFTDYLQTDASINRGNSGGALVNLDGEVIGINTFIASNSGGEHRVGFCDTHQQRPSSYRRFHQQGQCRICMARCEYGRPE